MTHISEDKLIQFSLEVISDETEINKIVNHLNECSACNDRFEEVRKDIETIGSIQLQTKPLVIPKIGRQKKYFYPVLQAAAIFIFGIVTGYFVSNWSDREVTYISSSYLTLAPPADSFIGFTESDATEISNHYYDKIIQDQ